MHQAPNTKRTANLLEARNPPPAHNKRKIHQDRFENKLMNSTNFIFTNFDS